MLNDLKWVYIISLRVKKTFRASRNCAIFGALTRSHDICAIGDTTVPARLTLRCSKIAGSETHSVQYNMPSCVLQDFLLLIILLCLLCFRTLSDPCCRLGWSDFWQTNWKLVSWSKRKFLTNKKCTFLRFLWFWKYNLCRARDQICRFF